MKLVTYIHNEAPSLGLVVNDRVIDLRSAYIQRDPEGILPPPDMLSLIQSGQQTWEILRQTAAWAETHPISSSYPLADIKISMPIANPSKIICVGLNYMDHCREQNLEIPKSPVLFAKFPSTLIGHEQPITWPGKVSSQVDYEAELAVIIGKKARNVMAKRAYEYVAGYSIINDISARDVQFADQQWVRGKSFDTFCPMGPFFVTPDEIGNPMELPIRLSLNGKVMQESNTNEMIFKLPYLIEFITQTCTLLPGDIISTGTPAGVGVFRDPKVLLKPGDLLEVEIDGLGLLRNRVE
ncbi:MAG TPA: FAA hydrolase family protein [Chloroflexi bacterium]|nr:FAA hydrolase family protein [Chloroflexota bacterium]